MENELKKALEKLTVELEKIDQNDAEARETLRQVVSRIELKLNEPDNASHHEGLMDQVKDQAAYFEARHPIIGSTLQDIVDILVRLGL